MIDMNKKYTYDGKSGRVLATDANNDDYPVVWLRDTDGGLYIFTSDGRHSISTKEIILIEVKPTRWVNIYRDMLPTEHHTKKDADGWAGGRTDRIACLEFTEGDGL